ncbi:DUF2637 domain-containing protein [Streptomyces sp. NBC_01601]|uniref:DUF2637 domain-containing protein n=1 Tax=Streptomyces sp. NBC_01601 TaxID=2975892 RepID=UPI002E288370|nr:DUF2637 domain-containing protein [Streptomyces sp. NBC_01601]
MNQAQRVLAAGVIAGAVVIAGIGFAGSYVAVRELAVRKGFGAFATLFPIGVDAGIAVLLALDLLLTWLRIPFPMLRQAAWLLTTATIGFNAAAAWPDPVGVGMHGVIPVLFVVTVEAARHAVGRLADITADQYMEGVRLWRWLLAPLPTFKLWRRMKIWEIRKYDDVIRAEQQRLVYTARLRGRFGWGWRWKAPVEDLMPLRIARYGIPLAASTQMRTRESEAALTGAAAEEWGKGSAPESRSQKAEPAQDAAGRAAWTDPPAEESATRWEASAGSDREPEVRTNGVPQDEGSNRAATRSNASGESAVSGPCAPRDQHDAVDEHRLAHAPSEGDAEPEEDFRAHVAAGTTSENTDLQSADPGAPGEEPQSGQALPGTELKGPSEAPDPASAEHEAAIGGLKSNASAVRYAVKVLGSTHTPTVVDWLASHGRVVNRGQAHKIIKDEAERKQQNQHLTVVKDAS